MGSTAKEYEKHFDSVEEAIQDIAAGKLVIVTDDESRENEGDLIMAASKATPETINMMIRYCSGIICVPTVEHQLKRLGLNPMVQHNREIHRTDFTVSVDAAEGVTTGISAYDRCVAIRILADPNSTPGDLVQPGHVFPLRAKPGGVLERAGHTEAAVDLAVLAGLHPSGVICEVMNDNGSVARVPDLIEFKKRFGLKMISIADLITYRHKKEKLVEKVLETPFASEYGDFTLHVFRNMIDGQQHFALSAGPLDHEPTLVRVQTENLLSDLFRAKGTQGCASLNKSLSKIAEAGRGVLLYLQRPNGGLQVEKTATGKKKANLASSSMDLRDYGVGAQILSLLGLKEIILLSSTKRKVIALDGHGLEIVGQEEI